MQDKIQVSRDNIAKVLSKVTERSAPNVYEAIQTEEGYREVETEIIRMVAEECLTISGTIPHINEAL